MAGVEVGELTLAGRALALPDVGCLALGPLGPVPQLGGGDALGLHRVDSTEQPGQQPCRVAADLVPAQREVVEAVEEHREAVGGPDGGEERVEPRLQRVLAEQSLRHGLVGGDPELLVRALDQGGRAGSQSVGAGPGASQNDDLLGWGSRRREAGQPSRQRLGPPEAGRAGDEHRAVAVLDHAPLGVGRRGRKTGCVSLHPAKLASDSAEGSGAQPSSMTAVARRQTQQPDAQPRGDALAADWIGACRRIVEAHRELFAEQRGIAARTVYAGIGEGGDRSLAIDRHCEDIVFAELNGLHDQGHAFTAISEERGEVTFGEPGSPVSVIVDPLDGSLNARRMLPSHSLSIAIATGPTMADVEFGYVYDFGASEEYTATRGKQAMLNGDELRAEGPGFGLEVVGIESAKPERMVPVLAALEGKAYRMRAVGSIAISLCYVAGGRFDGMLTGRACRSVDAAAGQLVARQAGAEVVFNGAGLDVSLDLDARYHVAAALDRDLLAPVLDAQQQAEPVRQPDS